MNLRICLKLLILTILPWALGCSHDEDSFSSGFYQYHGFDNELQEVTNGELTLMVDGSLISGQKNITGEAPESGENMIEGWIDDHDTVYVRFTFNKGPNMLIVGYYENGWLNGHRFLELISGPQAAGTFKAKKIDNRNVYRQIAWAYIDGEHNETIIGNMDDGVVRSDHYGVEPTVSVTWRTTQDALLGLITVHIDPINTKVLGINPRL